MAIKAVLNQAQASTLILHSVPHKLPDFCLSLAHSCTDLAHHNTKRFTAMQVNNAGIAVGPDGSLANISDLPVESAAKTLNYVFDTNVFAVVTVTNAFLPLLKAAPSARIVNVSSIAASLTHGVMVQPYAVYSSSKTALNAVTLHYAKDLAETNIKVNMICPGYCATEINGHSGPRSAAEGAEIAIKMATLPNVGPHGGFYDDNGSIPW
ncbi:hypothetical protein ABBQ32_007766 [Trebouxia sp. C0010 RCD-2024]